MGTKDINHIKYDVSDGCVVVGLGQPILFSFDLDKPPGYKTFCEPEAIHFIKMNKVVVNTLTFYSEDVDQKEVNSNGETFIFTLQ